MHARIDHLLSLRDGEPVDAAVRSHVEFCTECAEARSALETMRRRLIALPPVAAPAGGWDRLRARIGAPQDVATPRRGSGLIAIAASCAMLGVVAGVLLREEPGMSRLVTVPHEAVGSHERPTIAELRDRSRVLEEVLAALPSRPAVERAGTAFPIDALQAQVQWVDHQLSVSGAAHAGPEVTERLWRERVEIMNTLVQLRYVEAQRIAL
jgi:hypothetical protein